MTEEGDIKWRIDAWDSLAGRAFLCRRNPDRQEIAQLDSPVVFVAPPYFQPEPLASRAPGFAATRSTFQAGLFFGDGEEVGFETLEDAIAFIRRGYNSHGSEPLAGAPALRPRPIEGGDAGLALPLPELGRTSEAKELDAAIAKMVDAFRAAGSKRRDALAQTFTWEVKAIPLQHVHNHLVVAGCVLVEEMLRRVPLGGTPSDFAAWATPAYDLGACLWRLGLWHDVRHQLVTRVQQVFRKPKEVEQLFQLIAPHYSPNHGKHFQWGSLLDLAFPGERWSFRTERMGDNDVYAQLSSFPLPELAEHNYLVGKFKEPNLLTLLSAWSCRPRGGGNVTILDRALLLFAGACVVVDPLQREHKAFLPWWTEQNSSLGEAFRERLARDLWEWLAKQLPDRVFHTELEDMLQTVVQRWSGIRTASRASPIKAHVMAALDLDDIKKLELLLGEVIAGASGGESSEDASHEEDSSAEKTYRYESDEEA